MGTPTAEIDRLSRRDRTALRRLLIEATAAAGNEPTRDLARFVRDAPIGVLPQAAALHRVSGTVLRGLAGGESLPEDVREALRSTMQAASLHHLLVTGALSELAPAFDAEGLRWVVMKGPVIAARLYPDVGDRSYGDLDLLVARRDFHAAIAILENLGYSHVIRNWALAEQMLAGQVSMTSPSLNIDLHWHLHYSREDRRPFEIEPEAMIERARGVTVSGVDVPTFDPVDTLFTLAFHAARSDGHRLVWLKDVERSLTVESPDLDELVRRTLATRCGPPVGLILHRSGKLLGAPVPVAVVDALIPGPLRALDRWLGSVTHPVQFHERNTITRGFTRSARSTTLRTVLEIPGRSVRTLRRRLVPTTPNETDDPVEKARYLRAVSASARAPS